MDEILPPTTPMASTFPGWTLAGGPFAADPGAGLGSAASMDGNKMCVGAPSLFRGYVDCFVRPAGDDDDDDDDDDDLLGGWVGMQQIAADDANVRARFGASIRILGNRMIVGAPGVFARDTLTPAGAAYLYEFDELLNRWDPLPPPGSAEVRGDEDIFSANEQFGASVSVAENGRIAVGAPTNNLEMRIGAGRVYTFSGRRRNDDGASVPLQRPDPPLLGMQAGDLFGTSVALSGDGNRLLVGAPTTTSAGYAVLYEWKNDDDDDDEEEENGRWETVERFVGTQVGEGFGTHVAMLSRTGTVFAVGSPGHDGGAGRILVYARAAGGFFQVLGDGGILGDNRDDRLGDAGTFDGDADGGTVSLVAGTAGGTVRRYDLDRETSTWEVLHGELELSTGITSLSATSGARAFVAGEAAISEANIYVAEQAAAAAIPTQTPSSLETQTPSKVVPSQAANVAESGDTMGTSSPSASKSPPEAVPTATPSVARTNFVVNSYDDRFQRNSVIWITACVTALAVLLAIIIFQQMLIMAKNKQLDDEDAIYVDEAPQLKEEGQTIDDDDIYLSALKNAEPPGEQESYS